LTKEKNVAITNHENIFGCFACFGPAVCAFQYWKDMFVFNVQLCWPFLRICVMFVNVIIIVLKSCG